MKSSSESDEALISNTIAELCMILILLFFLSIGATVVPNAIQTKNQEKGVPVNKEKKPSFSDALFVNLDKLRCEYETAKNGSVLRLLMGGKNTQTSGGVNERSVFVDTSKELSSFGRTCVIEICRDISIILNERSASLHGVSIDGHASSEYRDYCGAPDTTDQACKICGDQFDCNLRLSMLRSLEVFRHCRGVFHAGHSDNFVDYAAEWRVDERLPSDTVFERKVRASGKSSAEIERWPNGDEDKLRSRRVEFTLESR